MVMLAFPWSEVITGFVCILIGCIIGFFIGQAFFKKQLKKNPPVNEKMIRAMFKQMGRTPSESQIRQVMNQMNQAK